MAKNSSTSTYTWQNASKTVGAYQKTVYCARWMTLRGGQGIKLNKQAYGFGSRPFPGARNMDMQTQRRLSCSLAVHRKV